MTHHRRGARSAASPDAGTAETARRMVRALSYLMQVSSAAGLSRVTAKLAVAQAELLAASGQPLIDLEPLDTLHDHAAPTRSGRRH